MRHRNPRGGCKNKEVGGTKFKFGQLIFRKIHKIVATRFYIIRLKCTKFDFGWGCTTVPTGGAYSAHPDSLKARTSSWI